MMRQVGEDGAGESRHAAQATGNQSKREASPFSASAAIWQDWQRIEEQVNALAPVLRHIDRVADNLRFARWNPLGPLQSIPRLWHELKRQWPAR